jgi:hypothetical protein
VEKIKTCKQKLSELKKYENIIKKKPCQYKLASITYRGG